MKIPKEVFGKNKIRDFKICRKYVVENMSMEEIGSSLGLTGSRVQQILYKNRGLLTLDKGFEKAKRINWLKRNIKERGYTKKDSADLMDQLRREIEDTDKISINQNSSMTIVINKTYHEPEPLKPRINLQEAMRGGDA